MLKTAPFDGEKRLTGFPINLTQTRAEMKLPN